MAEGIGEIYATNGDTSVECPPGVGEVKVINMPEGGSGDSVSWNDIVDKPTFSTVAMTGDYNDLGDKPTIRNVPESSAQDAGMILGVDNSGTPEWQPKPTFTQEQADWSESDSADPAFIKNKPQHLVQDANYVHTDNNFTSALKDKLDGIESGAEANVQADWNQSNSSEDDYIKNKPTIRNVPASTTLDSGKILKVDSNGDPEWANPQSYSQVQADWDQSDSAAVDYIKNKPTIPTVPVQDVEVNGSSVVNAQGVAEVTVPAQEQADWNQSNSAAVDFIKNKPTINNVPTVTSTDDSKVLKASYNGGTGSYSWETAPSGLPASTSADEGKLLGVDSSGDPEWQNAPTEVLHVDSTTAAATTATNIAAAITAGKEVIYDFDDGHGTKAQLPLTYYTSTTYLFAGLVNNNRRFVRTLSYENSAWAWGTLQKDTIGSGVPSSTSADAGKVLVVDSSGSPAWDDLATTQEIQAIVV